jgi:selenocysteine lyase/cysteine desulfurase
LQREIDLMATDIQNKTASALEAYFAPFRKNIVGIDQEFDGPYGRKKIIYADWTASGRLYGPIEKRIAEQMGGYVANTHTETSFTGKMMTKAYHEAKHIIKEHVNAGPGDVLIPAGTGMTGAVIKFQRILGIKIPERAQKYTDFPEEERPVIFITHMEHHSNQTSWLETMAKVELISANKEGLVDLDHLDQLIEKHKDAKHLIASVTGCSNVTGIETPYHEIARRMHKAGGMCFVDFACSGPYVKIDMHPKNDPDSSIDAVFLSPHKFLGGPGTPGLLIFNSKLYTNKIPDVPGGGTVTYTNPWGEHFYFDDIETREDGGTPGFLQTIKAALAIKLKEEMGVENILKREEELLEIIFPRLEKIPGLKIFADNVRHRLGVISFYIEKQHFNLGVSLLNDRFGIQTRGGCSCAGTYGHFLFDIDIDYSHEVMQQINQGDLTIKPGWIRMSIHPTMTNEEALYICEAIEQVATNWQEWGEDYVYDPVSNEYKHKTFHGNEDQKVNSWFTTTLK